MEREDARKNTTETKVAPLGKLFRVNIIFQWICFTLVFIYKYLLIESANRECIQTRDGDQTQNRRGKLCLIAPKSYIVWFCSSGSCGFVQASVTGVQYSDWPFFFGIGIVGYRIRQRLLQWETDFERTIFGHRQSPMNERELWWFGQWMRWMRIVIIVSFQFLSHAIFGKNTWQ